MRLRASLHVLGTATGCRPCRQHADAACTRLAFSVNDYGKDGPTKDAKNLLDTYIAKWTAERGIGKYTTGKKDVTCELFLDFGLFDEYTCKASASVCWEGNKMPIDAAAPAVGVKNKAATAPKAAPKPATTPVTTGAIPKSAPAPKPQ